MSQESYQYLMQSKLHCKLHCMLETTVLVR
jgi:hypothetical protein